MKPHIWALSLLAAYSSACCPALADDPVIVPGLTYVCNGERLHIDSCNIRDLSDNSTCMVAHPDHMRPNGFPTYTYETRGNLKKLLPTCQQPTPQQIAAAKNFQQRQQAAQDAAFKKAEASPPTPMPTREQVMQSLQPKDPAERAMNRCIAAGRLPASCTGNALLGGFSKMITSILPSVQDSSKPSAGPVMSGVYRGAGSWRLDFVDGGVLVNCSFLSPNEETYRLKFEGGRTALIINTKPTPLNLTVHADGTIVGPPGQVTIDGVVAGGSTGGGGMPERTETTSTTRYYQTVNGTIDSKTATETNYVAGTYTAPQTVFVPRRTTCPAVNLTSRGADVGIQTLQTGLLKTAFGGDKGPPTPPGIRMQGIYAAATGFSVQFFPESAVLGCGPDAARAYPYTVEAGPSGAVVKIEAPDHPLNLAIRPTNTLDPGSAALYQVHGRLLIGDAISGNYNFIPNEQSCGLAVLAPSPSIPANGGSAPVAQAK